MPDVGGREREARIRVLRARRDEVSVAAEILEDAIAWAAWRGFGSWTPGTFAEPDGWGRERLEQAQESGGLYLIWHEDEAVGTISLLPEDPVFWPDSPADALYLHRFAVRGSCSGKGIGAAALRWAYDEVLRRGRRVVRLDCLRDEPGIRAYYERAGFDHRGDVEVAGIRFSLYERRV